MVKYQDEVLYIRYHIMQCSSCNLSILNTLKVINRAHDVNSTELWIMLKPDFMVVSSEIDFMGNIQI